MMLEVQAASKRFGGLQALKNVSFTLADGEILGLICLLYTSPSPRD